MQPICKVMQPLCNVVQPICKVVQTICNVVQPIAGESENKAYSAQLHRAGIGLSLAINKFSKNDNKNTHTNFLCLKNT